MLLDLSDFALQEQQGDNLMVAISWAWYNGSYRAHIPWPLSPGRGGGGVSYERGGDARRLA